MGDEARVSYLKQQRNIAGRADRMCTFGVPHREFLRREPSLLEAQGRRQIWRPLRAAVAKRRMRSAPDRPVL